MKFLRKPFIFAVFIITIFLLFYRLGIAHYFTLESFKAQGDSFKEIVHNNYFVSLLVFIAVYAGTVLFGLPSFAPLTLLAGYLFGAIFGTIYSLIGAAAGCAGTFIAVRYFLSGTFRGKYAARLEQFKTRIEQGGYWYLISLQLLAVIPFFVINVLAALADVPLGLFLMTVVIGVAPLTFIFALAGRELQTIASVKDVVKPHMLALLVVLALLALLPNLIQRWRQRKKVKEVPHE